MKRVLLAAALVAAATAGCVDDPRQGGAAIAGTVAHERALEEARTWAADAELVLLSGVEAPGSHPATEREDDARLAVPADADVGDGRAPAWTALFYSEGENATLSVRVVGDQVRALEPTGSPETPVPLANWSVDSPEAAATALDERSFREAALAEGANVALTLGTEGGEPVWTLKARSGAHGGATTARVHAVNGTLLG